MAIDITKGSHVVAFPSKVAAASGSPHIFNINVDGNTDNGSLILKGAFNHLDNYDEDTTGTVTFSGVILGKATDTANSWYVEVTANTDALFVFNSPVSPYPERDLQDESLFYNADGDTVKAYSLIKGDVVSLSANAFNGTPVAGKAVSYVNGKYKVATGA